MNLLERIKKIEALINGATTTGEKNAALSAKDRLLEKHITKGMPEKLEEYRLYTSDSWHKKLLIAICRKHGIQPYRYKRQKYTTVMVNINPDFLNDILWPEYLEYSEHLEKLVEGITDDLIGKIHKHEDENIVHGRLE